MTMFIVIIRSSSTSTDTSTAPATAATPPPITAAGEEEAAALAAAATPPLARTGTRNFASSRTIVQTKWPLHGPGATRAWPAYMWMTHVPSSHCRNWCQRISPFDISEVLTTTVSKLHCDRATGPIRSTLGPTTRGGARVSGCLKTLQTIHITP